jgi:APA family basic amino acid/polyamine antiporter
LKPSTVGEGISFFSAVNVVIASMIGAGVYTTSGFALADLGSPVLVIAAWLVGGMLALCGAMSYGALAERFAESGGEYLFLSRALHPAAGNVAGFVSLLAGFTGAIAFAALTFEAYAGGFFAASATDPGGNPFSAFPGGIASLTVIAAAAVHGFRVRTGTRVQDGLVVIKLVMLVAFLAFAMISLREPWRGLSTAASPPAGSLVSTFAVTLMWISLSYSGFNAAIYITGEVRDSGPTVRRALWVGTLIVTTLYVVLNSVFVLAPPSEMVAGKQDIAAEAARYIGGERFQILFRFTILLSLGTSVLSLMMTGPRVYAKMADDGVLPAWFRSGKELPRLAIVAQAILAITVIQLASLRQLLSYLGLTLSLSAALTVISLLLLRHRGDKVYVPFYPWPPLIFVIGTLVISAIAGAKNPIEFAVAAATLGVGAAAYASRRRVSPDASDAGLGR